MSGVNSSASATPATITTTQRFSRRALNYLRDHITEFDAGTQQLIRTLNKNRKRGDLECTQTVTYERKLDGYGRYYGTKGSLEALQSECRATLCRDYYHDIDIVNAQPTLLTQLAERTGLQVPHLEAYVANRESFLAKVMSDLHVSREDAKDTVITVLFGANGATRELRNLHSELAAFAEALSNRPEYRDLARVARSRAVAKAKADPEWRGSWQGIFNSYAAQTIEATCMLAIKSAFEARGWAVGVLVYDGIMVEKREGLTIDVDLLQTIQNEVQVATSWRVAILEKPLVGFTLVEDDEDGVLGDDVLVDDAYAAARFVALLGADIVRQDGTIHIFSPTTGMWEPATEEVYLAAINRVRDGLIFKQRAPDGSKRIINYGGDTKKARLMVAQLPALIPNTNYLRDRTKSSVAQLLFADGIYNMRTGVFSEGFNRDTVFSTRINRPFNHVRDDAVIDEVLRTLFITPFTDPSVGAWYKNRLARALAGHTEDKAFYSLLGEPNTGKSTVTTLLSRTFDGFVRTWNLDNLKFKAGSTTDEAKRLSWVADLLSCRIALSNEARMDGVALDGNLIKRLSGGDALQLRRNFQDEQTHELMTTFFTLSNDLPAVSPCDAALRVRMNHARFNYSFVNKPAEECTEWERPADPSLKAKIESTAWRDAFTWIILDAYRDGVLPTPACVKAETDEYIPVDSQNVKAVLEENFEIVGAGAGEEDWVESRILINAIKTAGLNLSDTKIGRELSKIGLVKGVKKVGGRTVKVWFGVRE